jgi:hypothetical protein
MFLFSRHALNKHGSGVCWILLASVGGRRVLLRLLQPNLAFQPNWGCGNLGFFQLLQSNSSPGEV